MRTTVRLPDDVMRQVRRLAAETNRTLTAVIEDALREALGRRPKVRPQKPIHLPTFRGTGLMPGVDLDNNAALLDLMESEDGPP